MRVRICLFCLCACVCLCVMSAKLEYWIKSGTQLDAVDIHEVADPYCLVYLDDVKLMKTKHVRNDVNPVWNEKGGLIVKSGGKKEMKFMVYDKDRFTRDDFIGEATLSLSEVAECQVLERSLTLERKGKPVGYIHVQLKYTPI